MLSNKIKIFLYDNIENHPKIASNIYKFLLVNSLFISFLRNSSIFYSKHYNCFDSIDVSFTKIFINYCFCKLRDISYLNQRNDDRTKKSQDIIFSLKTFYLSVNENLRFKLKKLYINNVIQHLSFLNICEKMFI